MQPKQNSQYKLILLGFIVLGIFLWIRFLRTRFPSEIPFQLSLIRFLIIISIISIYLIITKQQIKPSTRFIQMLPKAFTNNFIKLYAPWHALDIFLQNVKYLRPVYKFVIVQFIALFKVETIYSLKISKNLYYLIIPKIALCFIFMLDIFYFQKLEIFYLIIPIGIIPLAIKYILHSIKEHFIPDSISYLKQQTFIKILSKDHENSNYFVDIAGLSTIIEDFHIIEDSSIIMPVTDFIKLQNAAYVCDFTPYEYEVYFSEHNQLTREHVKKLERDLSLVICASVIIDCFENPSKNKIINYIELTIMLLYVIGWTYILIISIHTLNPVEITNVIHSLMPREHNPFDM